jgi:hypothetical protein
MHKPLPPVKSVAWNVSLSGTGGTSGEVLKPPGPGTAIPYPAPPGAPYGSGLAVISTHASTRELCWKFSQLTNVTTPTRARIYRLASRIAWMTGFELSRRGGIVVGPAGRATYTSSGCLPENSAFLALLGAKPWQFYVAIDTPRFRLGAVRGQF